MRAAHTRSGRLVVARQDVHARVELSGIHGEVEIPVFTSLPTRKSVHTPPGGDPVSNLRRIERIEDVDDLSKLHTPILAGGGLVELAIFPLQHAHAWHGAWS